MGKGVRFGQSKDSAKALNGSLAKRYALGAAFFGVCSLALGIQLKEDAADGVAIIHSKGKVVGLFSRAVDPSAFEAALRLELAALVFCLCFALWAAWKAVRAHAHSKHVGDRAGEP